MGRVLVMLEVSQKQAYIFARNKLAENIHRSQEIARITGVSFISETVERFEEAEVHFSEEENLVYAGGGHTILEFEEIDAARKVVQVITRRVLEEIPEIEMFAVCLAYEDNQTPGENIDRLMKTMEHKKSIRNSTFHQGSFGIEKTDPDTRKVILWKDKEDEKTQEIQKEPAPEGFCATTAFDQLGISKGESSFIAIVHVDGNAMGKRVQQLAGKFPIGEWDSYKKEMRSFSEGIAKDYLAAYRDMEETVASIIRAEGLSELSLKKRGEQICLPIRRVISEGDDICFVAEGRIGVECARVFLELLHGKGYAACAGVSLVHQKYPFYRAYQLAEELCKQAKRFDVTLAGEEEGPKISAIDWHLEFGEIQDSLEETRRQYETEDGKRLELRPYIVCAPETWLEKEHLRQYRHFYKLTKQMQDKDEAYGRSTLKELRKILKRGEDAAAHYLKFHKIEELGKMFDETADGEKRSLIFDAIEIMDTWLPLEVKE